MRAIGVDETAFLRATGKQATQCATGIADLTAGRIPRLLDVTKGGSGVVLGEWLKARDASWRASIATASLDPFRGCATALTMQPCRWSRPAAEKLFASRLQVAEHRLWSRVWGTGVIGRFRGVFDGQLPRLGCRVARNATGQH